MSKPSTSETRTPAEILATIAAMNTAIGDEEYASRDHDKILYGELDYRTENMS
ncbi:MAG: hypothetical protein H0U76_28855 [Ktedonobacteraceae bacterium]|nr:hypothetical protein [Ktedonobacteraceae bacterium]MBA3944256.1 hypothetical protein [Herpetosiphonaceae bacterium]